MVILKKRHGAYQGIQGPSTQLISKAARVLLSLELTARDVSYSKQNLGGVDRLLRLIRPASRALLLTYKRS